jgi:hypothetical protein
LVTWARPDPVTTKLPEKSSEPGDFTSGSASPVRSDSSISSASDSITSASATTWPPGRSSMTSSSTMWSTLISTTLPSRTTCAAGAESTAS